MEAHISSTEVISYLETTEQLYQEMHAAIVGGHYTSLIRWKGMFARPTSLTHEQVRAVMDQLVADGHAVRVGITVIRGV